MYIQPEETNINDMDIGDIIIESVKQRMPSTKVHLGKYINNILNYKTVFNLDLIEGTWSNSHFDITVVSSITDRAELELYLLLTLNEMIKSAKKYEKLKIYTSTYDDRILEGLFLKGFKTSVTKDRLGKTKFYSEKFINYDKD